MSFIEEFKEFFRSQPRLALPQQDCENCDYTSFLYKSRNCYLCFESSRLEDCMYGGNSSNTNDCCDFENVLNSEFCYECINTKNCYNCNYCHDCENSRDLWFSYDCNSCQNCFLCVGLRRKSFMIMNRQYSEIEYAKKVEELLAQHTVDQFFEMLESAKLKIPHLYSRQLKTENCTGNNILASKNCLNAFNVNNSEDSGYIFDEMYGIKDSWDLDHVHNSELCFDCTAMDASYNVHHSFWVVNSNNIEHCICVYGCKDCFASYGLKHKQYNILNCQYSREEYGKRLFEIKNELIQEGVSNENLLALYA